MKHVKVEYRLKLICPQFKSLTSNSNYNRCCEYFSNILTKNSAKEPKISYDY